MKVAAAGQRRAELAARFPRWERLPIHEHFARSAAEFADREFVVTDSGSVTYARMQSWVEDLAAGLATAGLGRGDHIAVMLANYPEYIAVKYAVSRLGAVLVPLNYMFQLGELEYALRNSAAVALLTMAEFRGLNYLGMLDAIAPGWAVSGFGEVLPELRYVAQFAAMGRCRDGVPTLEELAAAGAGSSAAAAGVGGEDPSMILYTSGTTGSPKGVVWTHDQDARLGYGGALTRAFADGWRTQSALPLYHAFANNEVLNATMFVGGAVIPRLVFSAEDFLAAIARHRPHEIVTVPTMVVSLCESPAAATTDTSSVVALMSAGAPAPVWLWNKARELLGASELTTGFGMTETGGGPVMSRPEDGIEAVATTVGRPKLGGVAGMPETGLLSQVRTVDPLTGQVLPDGAEGELISRGPTNALGYWKNPAATAETFRDGWVFTGDLGRVLPDGSIQLTGRKKELIRTGAENVAPKEVEDLLTAHPAISQAYLVGIPDLKWGEIGCVWIVLEPGAELTGQQVLELCAPLARFKRPRSVRFLSAAELPTTLTGKVQKFVLANWAATRPETDR